MIQLVKVKIETKSNRISWINDFKLVFKIHDRYFGKGTTIQFNVWTVENIESMNVKWWFINLWLLLFLSLKFDIQVSEFRLELHFNSSYFITIIFSISMWSDWVGVSLYKPQALCCNSFSSFFVVVAVLSVCYLRWFAK